MTKRLYRRIKRYFKYRNSTMIFFVNLNNNDLKEVITNYSRCFKLGINVKIITY